MKQLTDQDAGFLYLETPETPQHIGSVSLVELPAGFTGDFFQTYKAHIASRLHLVPLLHSKLMPMPFEFDHPVWVEDDQVDIDYHVRRQTVPRPGTQTQLDELVGRLHSNFLDRSRPLWEFYLIDGLQNGKLAIYSKIHHAAMDGASSQLLIATLYDPTPEPREMPPPPPRAKGTPVELGISALVRGVVSNALRHEVRTLQFIPDALKAWSHMLLPNADTLEYDSFAPPPPQTPKMAFNVGISSQRSFAARSLKLSALKRTAKLAEVKLNDVVLALCAGGLQRYLGEKNALPKLPMTAMVPVSLREAGDLSASNQNAMFVCSLATDVADPFDRLKAIAKSSSGQKKLISNFKNALLPDLAAVGGGALMRTMTELYCRAKLIEKLPPLGNLWISNVQGPPVPVYVAGARILSFSPCSIPFHGAAINITAESYCDSLDIGFTACRRTLPDVEKLADYCMAAYEELQVAVERKIASPATEVVASPKASARQPALPRPATTPAAIESTPSPKRRSPAKVAKAVKPVAARQKKAEPVVAEAGVEVAAPVAAQVSPPRRRMSAKVATH